MPSRTDFAPGEFCWIDLSAKSLEEAGKWYAGLFGWSHQMMPDNEDGHPYAFFSQGENAIGGLGELPPEVVAMGAPPCWNHYVLTEDIEATTAKVPELGGTVHVPPTEVPGHGKLAYYLDPEGASIAAWQANPESGDAPALLVGEPNGLCWNELMTHDTDRAREFYGGLFGWDFAHQPMGDIDYTMIRNGDTDAGGMMKMEGEQFEGAPPTWMLYFAVEDCHATTKKATDTGGSVCMPPMEIPIGTFALLADPQGAMFGVVQLAEMEG